VAAGEQRIMEQITDGTIPDRAFIKFSIESLAAQLQAIMREAEGVKLAEDPEFLHRMRVASRRLRTRLKLFADCLPESKALLFRKRVRSLTRALGEARDCDVQIIHITEFMESLETRRQKEGLRRLLLRLTQKREGLQSAVIKAVTRMEDGRILTEMQELFRTVLGAMAFDKPEKPGSYAFMLASREIKGLLGELFGFEMYIREPARSAELHQMRIAAKHLRYAMESFEPLFKVRLKKPIKAAKTIQEILGDIHDCDVWTHFLPVFLEDEAEKAIFYSGNVRIIPRLKTGIMRLEKDRSEFRAKRYDEFLKVWEESLGVWQTLSDFLNSGGASENNPDEEQA
jgi:CHAD domain-containing protein